MASVFEAAGYPCRLLPGEAMEGLSGPLLLTALGADAQGRARQASWMFFPLAEGEAFDYLDLLQYYAEIPPGFPPEARPRLEQLILELNNQLPLGHLGISPSGALYHRYVLALDRQRAPGPEAMQQLLGVLDYVQSMCAPRLEAAAIPS